MRFQDEGDAPHSVAMSVSEGLQKYGNCLTPYEKKEITSYTNVYYCGQYCADKIDAPTSGPNDGFDTREGEYIFRPKDHIAYRYEIIGELGSGAFGQVLKAMDHANEKIVAIKLIRNQRKILQQAVHEIKILEHVNSHDPKNLYGIVRMIESFKFRGHICISYELLGINLYEYLKEKDFYPFPLSLIRGIAARMLVALTFLGRENIIHCDLKPENILLRGSDPSVVKLVDLGSASFDANNAFTYIQSRFYRAPEVILEQKYTKAIDWWSLGCILCELANGDPVFPGDDEKDQLGCIMEYLGPPPKSFISASSARRKREFFDEHLQPLERQTHKGKARVPGSKSLAEFLAVSEDDDFLSFVMQFLQWDPAARVSPREAMQHKWIRDEFIFPTNKEESNTAASTSNDETSSAVTSASKEEHKTALPMRTACGRSALQARSEVTTDSAATSSTQTAPKPAAHKLRSGPLTADDGKSLGVTSVPSPTVANGGSSPCATVQATGAAPQRPTAAQRHGGQASRGRRRRSTDMAEVEMPDGTAPSSSATATTAKEKTRDFLISAEGGGPTALTFGSATSRSVPRSGGNGYVAPGMRLGRFSPPALSVPAYSAASKRSSGDSATAMAVPKAGGNGVVATTAFIFPQSISKSNQNMPNGAEKSHHALEPQRKFEANGTSASTLYKKDHLESSARGGGNSTLHFVKAPGSNFTDKNLNDGSLSYSAKQRSIQELSPKSPLKGLSEKGQPERRKEYSLVIDSTSTPPALEFQLHSNERSRLHAKEYTMPSEFDQDTVNRGTSLLSASRPLEPGSSFVSSTKSVSRVPADEEVRSGGETGALLNPSYRLAGPDGFGAGGTTSAPPQLRNSIVPLHNAQHNGYTTRDLKGRHDQETTSGAVVDGARGRHPALVGTLRSAQQRLPLAQRQQQDRVKTLNDGKLPLSPTTVLPPLKKNSVR